MKIIVNSEEEQSLMERFFGLIHEMELIDELEKLDEKTAEEWNDEQYITSLEYEFLRQAFFYPSKIDIDKKEYPLTIEHDNISGQCVACGTITEGTIDGNDITLEEFKDFNSEDTHKTWKCEACYLKERE